MKLNQCTFRMQNASLDPNRPARLFLGEGVLGGAIPGATIQFDGVIGVGKITKTTFPYYPFISFSSLETDLTKIAGKYNQLGYHQVPSQSFQPVALDQQVTINADGSYVETDNFGKKNGGQPLASSATVNQPFTLRPDAPAFQSLNYLPQIPPTLAAVDPAKAGKGILIVGKLRNQFVPIFIRTGAANADLTQGPPSADDESGISFLGADGDRARLAERRVHGRRQRVQLPRDRARRRAGHAARSVQCVAGRAYACAEPRLHAEGARCRHDRACGCGVGAGDRQVRVHRRRIRVPRHERYEQPVLHGRRIRAVTQAWMETRRRRAQMRGARTE